MLKNSDLPSIEDCRFCAEFLDPPDAPNRLVWADERFVILPSIGSFTAGYTMLMPRAHVRSFALLPADQLAQAGVLVEHLRDLVEAKFGKAIIAEHGTGSNECRTVGCCDHAHWHVVPTDPIEVCHLYLATGGAPHVMRNASELASFAGKAYLYLSPLQDVHWKWDVSMSFTSQFVRRVCAEIAGVGDQFDWSVWQFPQNMLLTRERLLPAFDKFPPVACGAA